MSRAGTEKTPRHPLRAVAGGLCRAVGTLLLLGVIALYLPLSVPRMLGFEIYEVISGSMEPIIPVESVVYVRQTAPDGLAEGEVIAFTNGSEMPVVHRILQNDTAAAALTTKGDANRQSDMSTVPYSNVIGRVAYYLPYLGYVAHVFATGRGKLYALGTVAAAALLHLAAALLARSR